MPYQIYAYLQSPLLDEDGEPEPTMGFVFDEFLPETSKSVVTLYAEGLAIEYPTVNFEVVEVPS